MLIYSHYRTYITVPGSHNELQYYYKLLFKDTGQGGRTRVGREGHMASF